MQISIKIDNNIVADKVLWFLRHLKDDGVTIIYEPNIHESKTEPCSQNQKTQYSDEYVDKNWKEFAYNASGNTEQEDDEILNNKYGQYLNEKHNI